MAYLTYEQFKELKPNSTLTEVEFPPLLEKASDLLDSVTRFFYHNVDIQKDVVLRVKLFQKALATQIECMYDTGVDSIDKAIQVNSDFDSVSIGRTSVSKGGSSSTQKDGAFAAICEDALMYLKDTGLLYRGVRIKGRCF